jgi:hypothetical protein
MKKTNDLSPLMFFLKKCQINIIKKYFSYFFAKKQTKIHSEKMTRQIPQQLPLQPPPLLSPSLLTILHFSGKNSGGKCLKCVDQLPCETCITCARATKIPLCRCPFCFALNFAHYDESLFQKAKKCEGCHKYFLPEEELVV